MSKIELINASCADQTVDAVVNAANSGLWAGGGICGVIFQKAGLKELTQACSAYYNSLCVLKENGLHSISFPLISSGIFGGDLPDPAGESTKQCCRAYNKFIADYPEYEIDVKLCAFTSREMTSAQNVFNKFIK